MNPRTLSVLISKDVRLFFKNKFFAFITLFGLVFYVAVYYLLPATLEETLTVGWVGPELSAAFSEELKSEGLIIVYYASEELVRQPILQNELAAALIVPDDFSYQISQAKRPQIRVLTRSDVPAEYADMYKLVAQELMHMVLGQTLDIQAEEVLVGPDMAGAAISVRDRMLPVLIMFVLMMETMGLAALMTREIETGTLRALLVTSLSLRGLYLAKAVTGVLMALVQVLLLLWSTGGLRGELPLLLLVLILGSIMVTGTSFLIASVSRDMMSVIGWGMLAVVVFSIPAFNILLPGLASGWGRLFPSYYIVDPLHRLLNLGVGLGHVAPAVAGLCGFSILAFVLGIRALRGRLD